MNKELGVKILELRDKGMSYKEIKTELKCSLSTISYHCSLGQKEKTKRRQINRLSNKDKREQRNLLNRYYNTFRLGNWKKSRKARISFTFEQFKKLLEENPICYITGEKINYNDYSSWQIDHVIPHTRGGSNELNNLRPVTRIGNMMKSNMTYQELILLCKKVTENYQVGMVGIEPTPFQG